MLYLSIVFVGVLMILLLRSVARSERYFRQQYYRNKIHTDILFYNVCNSDSYATHSIYRPHIVLGRNKAWCDVCLGDMYDDNTISRRHAVLWYSQGSFYIKPLINGAKNDYTEIFVEHHRVPIEGTQLQLYEKVYIKGHVFELVDSSDKNR